MDTIPQKKDVSKGIQHWFCFNLWLKFNICCIFKTKQNLNFAWFIVIVFNIVWGLCTSSSTCQNDAACYINYNNTECRCRYGYLGSDCRNRKSWGQPVSTAWL